MSTFTAKYQIPVLQSSDPVATAPTVMAALANRMDLLLGEAGAFTASPAAATTLSVPIVLGRTYPGSNVGTVPGSVFLQVPTTTVGSGTTWNWWVTAWTGSASTITGFTLNMQWSVAQVSRVFHWRYLPVL